MRKLVMSVCCMHQHINAPGTIWCTQCESLVVGVRFDDYTVTSYLGQGSFGAIYLAQQHSLNKRTVVIKMSQGSWPQEAVATFRHEAAVLASLSHPYILPIHAYGLLHVLQKRNGSSYLPYVVLPYAEQGSLEDRLGQGRGGTLPLKRVLVLVEEIADALDYAHSRGVLHRDVKPGNVLLRGSHVMLSDFGVAALIDVETSHVRTSLAGSPAFMAPEVWRFSPGRYSDQYALAVTCFRLLTGAYPWYNPEGRVRDWTYLHGFVKPRSLQDYCPDLPESVNLVLQQALAKEPHERYPNVSAFASDLRAAASDTQMCVIPPKVQFKPTMPAQLQHEPLTVQVQVQERISIPVEQVARTNTITGNAVLPLAKRAEKEKKSLDVHTESLVRQRDRWVQRAFALNLLICLVLVAQAGFTQGNM